MAHVKEHTRRTKQGKLVYVHSFDDKRSKKDKPQSGKKDTAKRTPVKHVVKAADPGMVKMRKTITELLHTEAGRKELEDKIKAGGFRTSIPEVSDLYGVEQGTHHPLPDAFDHTMELFKHLPADASDNILWAALLHDIGKTDTQQVHEKRGIIFDGHEYQGYKMVKKVLARLGFDKKDADEISYLVLHHGNLRTQLLRRSTSEAQKFIDHPHFDSLLTLHKADVKASGRDPHEVLERLEMLRDTEDFRKDLYDNTAKELGIKSREVELNDDGTVSLYLEGSKKLEDRIPEIEEKAEETLKKHGLEKQWAAYTDYDENNGWVAVHFEPEDVAEKSLSGRNG